MFLIFTSTYLCSKMVEQNYYLEMVIICQGDKIKCREDQLSHGPMTTSRWQSSQTIVDKVHFRE